MSSHPARAVSPRAAAAVAFGGLLGLVTAATGLGGDGVRPAWAAERAGAIEVVDPAGGAPLTTGRSATAFRIKLPTGAACTKDSANEGYRIQSFLVPRSVSLDTLTFDSTGPVPVAGEYRSPLIDLGSSPYVDQQTANAVPVGGPGPIIQPLTPFDFVEFAPPFGSFIPAGSYSIGIACTFGNAATTELDRYWSGVMTVATDPADPGAGKISWTVSASAPATSTTLAVTPAGSAAPGAEVTLVATVSPAAAAGSVTFKDGSTSLGVVALSGGTATLKKSDLAPGPHSFTASFAPTVADDFAASVSPASAYTITAAGATTTTTTSVGSTTTTSAGSTTTTGSGTAGGSGSVAATTTGAGSSLARSGGTFVPLVTAALVLLWAGRVAVLLGRRPAAAARKR